MIIKYHFKDGKRGRRKPLSNADQSKIIKTIRPFVNFDYDLREVKKYGLSKSELNTAIKYYKEIETLKKNNYVYRPRNKTNLKIAKQYHNQSKLKNLRVAFIPTNVEKPKIKVKSGKILVESKNKKEKFLPFNPILLAADAFNHSKELISKESNNSQFQILAGNSKINIGYTKNELPKAVAELVNKYSNYANFLSGINVITFRNQSKDKNSFKRSKLNFNKRNKKRNKKQKK